MENGKNANFGQVFLANKKNKNMSQTKSFSVS